MTSASSRSRAALSRADLLRVIIAIGEHGLAPIASMLGYERVTSTANAPGNEPRLDPFTDSAGLRTEPPQPRIERPRMLPKSYYYQVTEREQLTPTQQRAETQAPAWLAQTQVLSHDERPDPAQVRIPRRLPLTRWSRLWPFLRAELGHDLPSREIDLTAAMARINRGEVLRRIPRRVRHDWNPRICILIDYHRPAQPFWEDFNTLTRAIARLHGKLGLDVRILVGEMARAPYYRHPLSDTLHRWRTPDPSTALLILGDLGAMAEAAAVQRGWAEFGSRLNAAGCRPVVLSPLFVDAHEVRLQRSFRIYQWDRQACLQRGTREARITGDASSAAELLLTLLAPALVVEPNLLRAMRYLLPAAQASALAESKVWANADVYSSAQGFRFASAAAAQKYQQRFSGLDAGRRAQAVALIRRHHAALPASVRYAELAVCQRLVPEHVDSAEQLAVQTWQQNIARTSLEHAESLALKNWRSRHVKRQAQFTDPATKALWALDQQDKLARGEAVEMPPDIALDEVAYFLRSADAQPLLCELSQRGDTLQLSLGSMTQDQDAFAYPLAKLTLSDARIHVAWDGNAEAAQIIQVSQLPRALLRLPQAAGRLQLRTADERLSISAISKPSWARTITRDREGLYARVDWEGTNCRLTWQPPQSGERLGRWEGDQRLGVDDYGLFADVLLSEGIRQRFRWILPGTFLMGSPTQEAERSENELQHEVTLTQGYWLAETTCTQVQWQAVMDENPSYFKDDSRNPVEQVSWGDVQRFIAKLNQRFPNLNACLPSEAQWEYACRAGTTTPFSFGENITPEQVNYNGEYPYASGKKGQNRGRTVPVGSLPANARGLYEMHGNVYEWCEDWYAEYSNEAQENPTGPKTGTNRVLRGGSWISIGRSVRSANRYRYGPGGRNDNFGFRLALGQGAGKGEAPAGEPRGTRGGKAGAGKSEDATITARLKKIFKRK